MLTIVHILNFFKQAFRRQNKRTGSEPMGMHTFEEGFSDGKARGRTEDGINFALWAKRALALIYPLDDVSRRENCHAVEASAGFALLDFGAMITAVIVGHDVIVFPAKPSKSAQEGH
jgi:hypothetical protein